MTPLTNSRTLFNSRSFFTAFCILNRFKLFKKSHDSRYLKLCHKVLSFYLRSGTGSKCLPGKRRKRERTLEPTWSGSDLLINPFRKGNIIFIIVQEVNPVESWELKEINGHWVFSICALSSYLHKDYSNVQDEAVEVHFGSVGDIFRIDIFNISFCSFAFQLHFIQK